MTAQSTTCPARKKSFMGRREKSRESGCPAPHYRHPSCRIRPHPSTTTPSTSGNGGIDNSFGANLMPIWTTLDSTYSQTINNSIQTGTWAQMATVFGFDDSAGNMTSATGLRGVELIGGMTSAPPTWDMNTHWPIVPEDLTCRPVALVM